MSGLFKIQRKGRRGSSNAPPRNAVPSTPTGEQSDLPIERIDLALEIASILKDASEGSPLLAPLKATCALIIRCLEVTRDAHQTRSELHEITFLLKSQMNTMEMLASRLDSDNRASSELRPKLETYLKVIQDAVIETSAQGTSPKSGRLNSLLRTGQTNAAILKEKLNESYQEFMDATLFVVSEQVDERAILAARGQGLVEGKNWQEATEPSGGMEYEDDSPLPLLYGHGIPCCQPGTRTTILADINQWATDTSVKEQIYWLNDAAGTGKTTVAATCARNWQGNNTLCGRFFFTPNSEASSGIDRFCTTVAKDIAFLLPSLDSCIKNALKEVSKRRCGFHEQFEKLIVKPLQSSKLDSHRVLILDALDNCDSSGRSTLLNCVLEHLPSIRNVKLLITSRPSLDIVSVLSKSALVRGHDVQLLDIHDKTHADVRTYVGDTLTRLNDQQREQIVEYSGGLFIVAATICRMLRLSAQPATLLTKLLTADDKDHLDELYLEVLRQAVWNGGAHEKMMKVLQIIIIAFQPVSINTIAYFLSAKFDVGKLVQDLAAVLKDGHPERPIKVLHPTFREFLSEYDRANGFIITAPSSHALTAVGCLDALEKLLDHDILRLGRDHKLIPRNSNVDNLNKRLSIATTAALRYASSYWAHHVAASLDDSDVWMRTMHFLGTKALNLVELMSWRGDLRGCIQGLSRLRIKVLHSLHKGPDLLEKPEAAKISHIYQFLLQNQPMIQDSALHTYASALAFTPEGSPLLDEYRRKYVSQMPRVISTTPNIWTSRDVLIGHTDYVQQLEFSPDGSRLASRAEDHSLILWDTDSGAIVGRFSNEDTRDQVISLTFSPDGECLAFATKASKIHTWNTKDGEQKIHIIDAGPGEMVQIAFSPIEQYLISASTDKRYSKWEANNNMRLWSTLSGQKLGQTMRLEDGACSIAVSPDGTRVACVSTRNPWTSEGIVTLWSLGSFTQLAEYKMPIVHDIHCVSYSPTGNRFVSWNEDGAIYLRDGITGGPVNLIGGQGGTLRGILFSPNGDIMASFYGRENPVVLLWDPSAGVKMFTLSGHSDTISYLSFSQDGLRLASISIDETVRVWDTTSGNSLKSFFDGYTGYASDPVLSPDWEKLVTVSASHQINLHDVRTGTMRGIESYEEISLDLAPPKVAFSPNRDSVVCGYMDLNDRSTLGQWSLETCTRIGEPMVGHKGGIICVAFSYDAKYISSLSIDNTMRIWDGVTGAPIGDPYPMYDGCYTIFSPDSRLVGCCSYGAIKVWNVHTRASHFHLEKRVSAHKVAFSPESSRLVGGFEGKICLWNIADEPFESPKLTSSTGGSFEDLAFSPKEDLLATVGASTIRLWRITDGMHLIAEVSISPVDAFRLGISNDGRYLAYGSSIWDLSSLPERPVPLDFKDKDSPSLDWRAFPHSLLTYHQGWIHSGYPPGPLLPIPRDLWDHFRNWGACGQKIVIWTQQRLPMVIDTSPLLE